MSPENLINDLSKRKNAISHGQAKAIFEYVTKDERPSFALIGEALSLASSTVERKARKIREAGFKIGKLRHNYNSNNCYTDMSDLIKFKY